MKPGLPAFRICWLFFALLQCWPITAAGHNPGQEAGHGHQTGIAEESESVAPGEWVQEKTGDYVPLDTVFKNERDEPVTLGQLIDRPTLLLPVYYSCPKLCSFDLANLADAVRRSSRAPGSFRVLSLSFNTSDTPQTAAAVKPNYTQLLAKDFPEEGWTFLTGDANNILKVTQAIGYTFKEKDDSTFIHPSALVVLAKNGQIIKYVYGSFLSGDVDIALFEAARGTPATSIHRLLAFCFSSNPRQNQQVFDIVKIGAVTILVIGGGFLLFFLRRKKTQRANSDT